jgi:hypothetical protein
MGRLLVLGFTLHPVIWSAKALSSSALQITKARRVFMTRLAHLLVKDQRSQVLRPV